MEGFALALLSSISHTFQSYRVSVLTFVASSLEEFISTPTHRLHKVVAHQLPTSQLCKCLHHLLKTVSFVDASVTSLVQSDL